jgi:hypothetical protein
MNPRKTFVGFISLLVVWMIPVSMISAQGNSVRQIVKDFTDFQANAPQEKLYIKTDREAYWAGDTLWFSSLLVDGHLHLPSSISRVSYAEFIHENGEILYTENLLSNENGFSGNHFVLGDTLSSGIYRLRGYTKYMQNFDSEYFFDKPIYILDADENPALQTVNDWVPEVKIGVFPEGGTIIAGIEKRVAIQVRDAFNNPISGEGVILNQSGDKVASFKTEHEGMTSVVFTPKAEESYFVQFNYQNISFSESFPEIDEEGYSMSVIHNYDRVYVVVQGSEGISFENSLLLVQSRGIISSASYLSREQDFFFASFPKDELPVGINQLTFFDPLGTPRCERLLLSHEQEGRPQMNIELGAESITSRSKIKGEIKLQNVKQRVNGGVNITILPYNEYIDFGENVNSYLSLTSDLEGRIYNPQQYFDPSEPDLIRKQDLLMLTHGWRRFDWDEVTKRNFRKIKSKPETGFTIEGKVSGYVFRKNEKSKKISLTFLEDVNVELEKESDEDGYFRFDGLEIYDEATAVIRTVPEKKKQIVDNNTFIELFGRKAPEVDQKSYAPLNTDPNTLFALTAKKDKLDKIKRAYGNDVIMLDEINIEGKNAADIQYKTGYSQPDFRIFPDSLEGSESMRSVYDVLKRVSVPGVKVVGVAPEEELVIRNNESGRQKVNYMVDGIMTNKDALRNFNVDNIAMIDILSAERSTLFASSLTVAIYSKNEVYGENYFEAIDPRGWALLEINGFEAPREFYMPDYQNDKMVKPDLRSTVYWNPYIEIKDGSAAFSFYTADEKGDFIVIAEGLTTDGVPLVATERFTVK